MLLSHFPYFPFSSKRDAPFCCLGFDYSHVDWLVCVITSSTPWEDILNLVVCGPASEVQVGLSWN